MPKLFIFTRRIRSSERLGEGTVPDPYWVSLNSSVSISKVVINGWTKFPIVTVCLLGYGQCGVNKILNHHRDYHSSICKVQEKVACPRGWTAVLEEVIPDAAWYLTQPSTYLGGAPDQNTEPEPENNKALCSLKERVKKAKGPCPPFRIIGNLVSSTWRGLVISKSLHRCELWG